MISSEKRRRFGWLVAGLVLAAQGAAAEISLDLPVACRPGVDCWVVNYVDLDPGAGVRDYACGRVTYDGHKGVDIAVRDFSLVTRGVPVRASAPGNVLRVRDGEADTPQGPARGEIAGRECGNGLVIGHGQGWTTQYCHLRKGSIGVKPGQRVVAGDIIGMVGQSGLAEFPHVHLQVAKNDTIVDPFRGTEPGGNACGLGAKPLWSPAALAAMPYRPGAISNGGITDEQPDAISTRMGRHREVAARATAPTLFVWADFYWVAVGDRVRLRLFGPNNEMLINGAQVVEKLQARQFIFTGTPRKTPVWPTGTYRAEFVVLRDKDGRLSEEARLTHAIEIR